MKEFITRAVEVDAEEHEKGGGEKQTYPFKVDGRVCTSYAPTSGQLGVFTALISDINGWQTQSAGIINFFLGIMDEGTKSYLATRLLDRNDPFEIDDVRDIMINLMQEWTANPTDGQSGTSGSPSDDGPSSSTSSAEVAST